MAFPSAPFALWSVSLLTVLFTAAVHSNTSFGKHISLSLCICLPLTVSPWAPDLPDPLSLSLVVPLICLLEAFSLFSVL